MRYPCWFCGKSATSELPDDSVIRALLVCPECIEKGAIGFPEDATGFPASLDKKLARKP